MKEPFDLERYLTAGVENIVKGAMKISLKNHRESLFVARYLVASRKAAALRRSAEERGEHIPPFLIASVTTACNLHCAGCYARANHACLDTEAEGQMSDDDWEKVFAEAAGLGIGFILLAGGEPMLRRDILTSAAKFQEILFPVFTNGTMFDMDYLKLFNRSRNLLPVLSIEGGEDNTDDRRGRGMYRQLQNTMELLHKDGILFGASVTVTKENLREVTGREFLDNLCHHGCKAIFYIEFVPVNSKARGMAPEEEEREYMNQKLLELREIYGDMLFISFPGDEKSSGGCLAAGRGFFHINAFGGAEPCPFSPYSDISVKESSIREALQSRLFTGLREQGVLMEDHAGGCVLFEKKEQVEALAGGQ
ncbi:radical SAM protein [Wansuia hejianensis]|uniref:Radical SAM protein n=1 Tax=Wansuia hejianensis TaxID=2763667 RepID=A0A7G9GEM5_9FIRM|nr:radical SAM protein [Wansuia hejianensis]QNM09257.1 radical SAM protein [Wansuia hejianensis]RHV92199.1 radical SAM protein [Lachnospiraceae bacterium OF09-33XD]